MKIRIEGQLASLQRPNEARLFVNGTLVWEETIDGEFGFRDFSIGIALRAGENRLDLVSKWPGAAASPNDPRELALAVRNLRFSDEDKKFKISLIQ